MDFFSLDCSSLSTFEIISGQLAASNYFGVALGPRADFDLAYTLTVVRESQYSQLTQHHHSGRLVEKSARTTDCEEDTDGCLLQLAAISSTTFTSMACVFRITAKGPAQPDVLAEAFNGAICHWQVNPAGYGWIFEVFL